MRMTWNTATILLVIAIICFALAAIGLKVDINLTALGLAFGFASFLVGSVRGPRL
jgi:hypothetical protein